MNKIIAVSALAALLGCTGFEAETFPATLGGKPATAIVQLQTGKGRVFAVDIQQAGASCSTSWRFDNLARTLPLSVTCADGRFGKGTATRRGEAFSVAFTLNDGTNGTTRIGPK